MSKYSDHTTVGGQVLAHRVRMMKQNGRIIFLVGYFGGLAFFFGSMLYCWNLNEIWNYLCCVKASYRATLPWLSPRFLNTSYILSDSGVWGLFADKSILLDRGMAAFKVSFEQSLFFNIKLSICFAIFAMIAMLFINKKLGKSLSDNKELLSGRDYSEGNKIKKFIKDKSDITMAEIPYPKNTECRHTILTGTTGSGKTNVMIELLDQIVTKNEKVIIVDTIGTFVDRYYKAGRDIILNPLDEDNRYEHWSFLSECRCDIGHHYAGYNETLIKDAAACLIDGGLHDKFWEDAAKIVFVETAKKAIEERKTTTEFMDILLKMPLKKIEEYLKGTYGHTLMDTRADKMAISIRATLINAISIFDALKESDSNNFSIKDWILLPSGGEQSPEAARFLFLSCTPAQRATLIPIITAWLSMATEYLLHTKPTSNRTWLFIDELHNLQRLPKIETSLAEIRKYGGCFVIGTQMVSQLNKIYGHEIAKTITGLCGTKIVMGIPEPETAKYMSGFLGEKEEVSTTEGISYGANTIRDGVNIAQKTEKKQTVPYTEIMDLKPGEAFIRFSGVDMVTKAKFKFHPISSESKKESSNQIISLQEYVLKNPPSENDLLLYGIPLNESILSKPICIFDNDLNNISNMLQMVRTKNEKAVVFEDGSSLYKACFKKESDILINPNKENGYSWNVLKDFDNDYGLLTQALIGKFDERDSKDAQRYLMTVFMNMNNIFSEINVKNVLSAIMFAPMKNAAKTLSRVFDLDSQKYSDIRTDLMINNDHLSLLLNDKDNVAIRDYVADNSYNGKIMFVSCFDDSKMKEIMKLIINYCSIEETITIHDTSYADHAKNRKAIVVCDEKTQISDNNGSVIVRYETAQTNKILQSVFGNALRNEGEIPQFLAKAHTVSDIIEIS